MLHNVINIYSKEKPVQCQLKTENVFVIKCNEFKHFLHVFYFE